MLGGPYRAAYLCDILIRLRRTLDHKIANDPNYANYSSDVTISKVNFYTHDMDAVRFLTTATVNKTPDQSRISEYLNYFPAISDSDP